MHYQTLINQRLKVFHQLFSWTSVGPSKCSTKWSVQKSIWEFEQFPGCNMPSSWGSFKVNSFEMNEFPNQPLKKLVIISIKLACFFKLFYNQRLQAFYQLISWTSVGLSKCPIDKMISSQGHLIVWRVPWVPCEQAKSSITENFFQINNFSN